MTRAILVVMTLFLSSCSLMGPDYEKPEINIPKKWANKVTEADYTTQNIPYLAWWKRYDDPTLNKLIEKALLVNNNVQISISNVEAAQGELEQVELGWLPQFTLLGGLSQLPNLGYPGTFLAFIPNYILNIFTQIKKQEYAELGVESAKFADDAVRLSTIGMVANSYFTYLAQKQLYQDFLNLEKTLNKLSELITAEAKIGTKNLIDIKVINAKVENIKAQTKIFKHNIVVSSNALKYLINENPGVVLTDKLFSSLDVSTVDYASLPTQVLADRPDVAYAETKLKMTNTAIGVATSSFLPGINLKAFISQLSNTDPGPFNSVEVPNQFVDLNQAMITYDFDPSMIGKISTASSEYRASYYNYFNVVRLALKEVDTSLSANQLFTESYQDLLNAYSLTDEQYLLVNQLYKIGLDSLIETLIVKVELQTLKIDLTQNKLQQLLTVVSLYQNLGGGYLHGTKKQNSNQINKQSR